MDMVGIWNRLTVPTRGEGTEAQITRGPHPWWYLFACLAIVSLQVLLIVRHTYFVDEWQSLQLAVQTPDLASLLVQLRYEGHPPAWHLLLRLIAKIIGPAQTLMAASLLLAFTFQLLILFASPFDRLVRICIALSEPMLFEFGVISRSYALGVMLMILVVALWQHRRLVWLVLALLPLTEFLFGVIACLLIVRRFFERRMWWPGVTIFAVAGLLAAWTVLPAPDFVPIYSPPETPLAGVALLARVLSLVAVPLQWSANGPAWNSLPPTQLTALLWIGFLLVCWDQTRRVLLDRVLIFVLLGIYLVFFAALYTLGVRHVQLVAVFVTAIAWLQAREGFAIGKPYRIWIAISAACGLITGWVALQKPFDRAEEVAAFIEREGLTQHSWVAWPTQHAQGVSAMTGILFEGTETGCASDFVRWNFRTEINTPALMEAWLAREVGKGRFYLASGFPLQGPVPLRELTHFPGGYNDHPFWLYEVGSPSQPMREPAGRCVPGMKPLHIER